MLNSYTIMVATDFPNYILSHETVWLILLIILIIYQQHLEKSNQMRRNRGQPTMASIEIVQQKVAVVELMGR